MLVLRSFAALLLTSSLTMACGGSKDAPASGAGTTAPSVKEGPKVDAAAIAKADEIYAQRCTPCHGASGAGDGAASASLEPKPRNFGDAAWQASVKDDYITKIIKVGGAGVGKAATMPSNPDLNNAAVLTALKDKIRSFGGK